MRKKKFITIAIYISALALIFLYVNSVLKQERIEIYKEKKVETEKTYPIEVSLIHINGTRQETYKKTLDSNENVGKLLKELRNDDGLIFELNQYTYGTEILSVNGVLPKEGYKWVILQGETDVTKNMNETTLVKDGVYTLKVVER